MVTTLDRDVSNFERESYFTRFRRAVGKYQYLIEERVSDLAGTDIRLGDIALGDMDQLVKNNARNLARKGVRETFQNQGYALKLSILSLIFPGIKKSVISGIYRKVYREVLSKTDEARKSLRGCSYKDHCIYLSTENIPEDLETTIDPNSVHELTHCLWEVLGGEKSYELPVDSNEDKSRAFAEGFAIYGERCWFYDFYPNQTRQRVNHELLDSLHPSVKATLKIKDLVKKHGQQILLKIPGDWKKLEISV